MAVIATGSIAVVLMLVLIYSYTHQAPVRHDPERRITAIYTTILTKIQSLFHRK